MKRHIPPPRSALAAENAGAILIIGPRFRFRANGNSPFHRTQPIAIGPAYFSVLSESPVSDNRTMDEREFFDEKESKKAHTLTCPHCRQQGEYELSWLVRTKKKQLSGRADERDRAKFAKAQSYMVRRDDMAMCKNIRCRKRFEVAGVQSVAFLN